MTTPNRRLAPGFSFVHPTSDEMEELDYSMGAEVDGARELVSLSALQRQILETQQVTETRYRQLEHTLLSAVERLTLQVGRTQGQAQEGFAGQSRGPPHRPPSPAARGGSDASHRRRINVGNMEKMEGNISLREFQTWRNRWNDLCRLEGIGDHPIEEQTAALRMCLSPAMQQVVEIALNISPTSAHSPDQVLDSIFAHIRSKRNVALDRVDFEMCRQESGESFDDFYIRLKLIADCADLCVTCADQRMTTRIMSGISNQDTRQRLLALSPFPALQTVINICRSEESAAQNGVQLSGRKVSKVKGVPHNKSSKEPDKTGKKCCKSCGRPPHGKDETCPAVGRACSNCKKIGHFAKVCGGKKNDDKPNPSNHKHIAGSIRVAQLTAALQAPKVQVEVLDGERCVTKLLATPDSGAETSVAGLDFLSSIGEYPENLLPANLDLVTASNASMSAIGRIPLSFRYYGRTAGADVIICPEVRGALLGWMTCRDLGILHTSYPKPVLDARVAAVTSPGDTAVEVAEIEKIHSELMVEFADVFTNTDYLHTVTGPPMEIQLTDEAIPFAVNGARPIPFALRTDVKELFDEMVAKEIIQPVTEPTEWTHSFVVVPKAGGGIRGCVDLTRLNKFVRRPTHPLLTTKDAISGVARGSRYFTTADASHGYWQLPLAESSQLLTTFMTPWGRYKFLRAPMGLVSTGDEYNRRTDAVFAGLEHFTKFVDDFCVWDADLEQHLTHVRAFLTRCRTHKVTLNAAKFKFAQHSVKFGGFVLGPDGVAADPSKLAAIADFPRPTNITQLRSFMGLAEQLACFSPHISAAASPLRPLLKPTNEFIWLPDHDAAFKRIKTELVSPAVLAQFDPALETALQTDASRRNGLGYALMQKHGTQWRLIECGSRFLTDTESRYAAVELEMRGVEWAMRKCKLYLLGLPRFTLVVDHQALVTILDKYTLDAVENPRLQRMKERLTPFIFETTWRKGVDHAIPDALSRAPVSDPTPEDLEIDDEVTVQVQQTIRVRVVEIHDEEERDMGHLTDPAIETLRTTADTDEEYQTLINNIKNGFPAKKEDGHPFVRQFWSIRNELSTADGLVLFDARLVIPSASRKEVLIKLHASHQGVERTKRRARQSVFWPGINADIANAVGACRLCQEHRPSLPKEPLMSDPAPSRVFEDVSVDLFTHAGKHYAVYADRLSGWPILDCWSRDPTARDVVKVIARSFVALGVPVRLRSDGGPQFASKEFKAFLERWGVRHCVSTPHYPQSNGHAEAAVKAMKSLVIKTSTSGELDAENFQQALIEWRNTPRACGRPPAQIVFGHNLRSLVPAHRSSFAPEWQASVELCNERAARDAGKAKVDYDQRAKKLKPLTIGATCECRITSLSCGIVWDKSSPSDAAVITGSNSLEGTSCGATADS